MHPDPGPHDDLSRWRHDVRNKLNLIRGYCSLLTMEALSAEQQEYVREIAAAEQEIQEAMEGIAKIVAVRERKVLNDD